MTIRAARLACVCMLSLGALANCTSSSDRPPRSQATRGGFSVLVDGPGRPAATRVVADIGSYAQERGFVRQAASSEPLADPVTHEILPTPPERYRREGVELVVSYQPADHRVSAYLHGTGGDRTLVTGFYRGFDGAYAPRYGGDDPISETGFAEEYAGPTVPERAPGASVPNPGGGFQGASGPPR